MSDRGLLEKAAKAAGMPHQWNEFWGGFFIPNGDGSWKAECWNPLTDDGDALRLAVKTRIEIEPWIHGDSACARAAVGEVHFYEPHYGDDPGRATRRAIVRAAAAIADQEGKV